MPSQKCWLLWRNKPLKEFLDFCLHIGSTLEVPHLYLQSPSLVPKVRLHVTGIQSSAVRHWVPPTHQRNPYVWVFMTASQKLPNGFSKNVAEPPGQLMLPLLTWPDFNLMYFKWSSALFRFHQSWGRTLYSNRWWVFSSPLLKFYFLMWVFVLRERPCDCTQKIYLVHQWSRKTGLNGRWWVI